MKRYDSVNITGNWLVERYEDVYLCSDVVECIAKLEHLLKHRDGGSHDAYCRSHYDTGLCNCGHDAVAKYFEENK